MTADAPDVTADEVEELSADALRWLLGNAREDEDGGLAWTTTPSDDEPNASLYSGTAGVIPLLLEARRHFGDDRYGDAAVRAARSVAAAVDGWDGSSLRAGQFPAAERRAQFHTDMARAWWQWGKAAQTATALMDALRVSPSEVRDRPALRRIVTDLRDHHPLVPGVRELAALTG
ncbi:hypothetical protein [Streptomyces sp. NPDC008139]|uniref:hypothetical protein n=1 Tax=Streptomyces sp. NPDC008139 TaxID=3364814 RepID=UPI0036E47297